jgi:hypothetical protein
MRKHLTSIRTTQNVTFFTKLSIQVSGRSEQGGLYHQLVFSLLSYRYGLSLAYYFPFMDPIQLWDVRCVFGIHARTWRTAGYLAWSESGEATPLHPFISNNCYSIGCCAWILWLIRPGSWHSFRRENLATELQSHQKNTFSFSLCLYIKQV